MVADVTYGDLDETSTARRLSHIYKLCMENLGKPIKTHCTLKDPGPELLRKQITKGRREKNLIRHTTPQPEAADSAVCTEGIVL